MTETKIFYFKFKMTDGSNRFAKEQWYVSYVFTLINPLQTL
jgi:hypothetical protein